jgi:peptidoglycan/LPS O-acetylase OafA/YrhL
MTSGKTISDNPDRPDYFPSLTGMRMIAATMVFLHHDNLFSPSVFGKYFPAFVAEFHVGVTIFFVLSGFLICYRYQEPFSLKEIRLWDYFINRFSRIYPVYFLATLIVFLPFVCHCRFDTSLFLLNISFLRGLFADYRRTGIIAGWSLTVEEMFYAFFPLMVLISGRIRFIFQPILFIAAGLLLWVIFRNVPFHGFFSSLNFLFEFTFFGRCFEFYCGIFLALYVKKYGIRIRQGKKAFCSMGAICWIIVCIGGLAINTHQTKDPGWRLLYETLLNNFLLPPGIALLFYGLLTERSLVQRVLGSTLFVQLGKSSYVFYLMHLTPLFTLLYNAFYQKSVLVFIAMQFIAFILYTWVERPLNRLIRRQFSHPPPPDAPGPAPRLL